MSFYDLKRNWVYIAVGAVVAFALMIIPVVSKPVVGVVAKIRDMVGGK